MVVYYVYTSRIAQLQLNFPDLRSVAFRFLFPFLLSVSIVLDNGTMGREKEREREGEREKGMRVEKELGGTSNYVRFMA